MAGSRTDFETLDHLLAERFSCRAFLADAVPRPTLDKILKAAQRTASWCNVQPWQVCIASGASMEAVRAAMMSHATSEPPPVPEPDLSWPREYRGVLLERRRECGWGLYQALGIGKGDRAASARQAARNFDMFGAPHLAVISCDAALGAYGAMDCAAYVGNFMLAASSLGVGSVAQAALAGYPAVLRGHLGIPAGKLILCGISFGFVDPAHDANRFRTRRADPSECVSWRD